MTVRIVDPNPQPEVIQRAVCRHCGVKLEYVPSDTKENYISDYRGDRDYYNYIECPNCHREVVVK